MFAVGRGLKRNMSEEAITIQFPEISEVAVLETVDRGGHTPTTVSVHFSTVSKHKSHEVDGRKVFSVTKETVGQVMSRDDPFYLPHQDNPFCAVFKDAKAKLMGSRREHWGPLIDLHWPVGRDKELMEAATLVPRRCVSLPGSPPVHRKELDTRLNDSFPPLKPHGGEEDTQSEGASSTDSAVGLEPVPRDAMYVRFSNKYFALRKFSIDPGVISGPSRVNRTDLIARQLEARVLDDALQRRFRQHDAAGGGSASEECGPCSFSSSESCMSLDENSIMSPTSSYSSYSENDSELWFNRAQLELYEHRLRSRERFQELVRRWEEKQGRSPSSRSNCLSPSTALRVPQRLYLQYERNYNPSDPGMDRSFQELRDKFELKQLHSTQDTNRSSSNVKHTSHKH